MNKSELKNIAEGLIETFNYAGKESIKLYEEGLKIEIKEDNSKVYFLHGPLFFGSITDFNQGFNPAEDPDEVIVDMMDSRVWDHSGLEAIQKLGARYQAVGKNIKLQHISSNCRELLKKAGSMVDIVVLPDDPSYHVANLIKSDRIPSTRQ